MGPFVQAVRSVKDLPMLMTLDAGSIHETEFSLDDAVKQKNVKEGMRSMRVLSFFF